MCEEATHSRERTHMCALASAAYNNSRTIRNKTANGHPLSGSLTEAWYSRSVALNQRYMRSGTHTGSGHVVLELSIACMCGSVVFNTRRAYNLVNVRQRLTPCVREQHTAAKRTRRQALASISFFAVEPTGTKWTVNGHTLSGSLTEVKNVEARRDSTCMFV